MTEQEILKKIDAWDEQDKIQPIIDFIENLPLEQRTTEVLSELARAYNNMYWLDNTEDKEHYLRKAIDIFHYIEDELGQTPRWNYRIGYSYFYLNDISNAKKYFEKAIALGGSGNGEENFLKDIAMAEQKNISAVDVSLGGKGGVEYPLERLLNLFQEKAPKLANILDKPATELELESFEKEIGVDLPEDFKQLHLTFSGQKQDIPFFETGNQSFVGIEDVAKLRERWLNFVQEHYGEDWASIQLSEDDFVDEDTIKNTLFNPKWIPLLAGEYFLICIDLDPKDENYFGQIISVSLSENIEEFNINWLFNGIASWIDYMERHIETNTIYYDEAENLMRFTTDDEGLPAYYDKEDMEELEKNIEREFGKSSEVFHELVSPDIHCDIYIIEPTPERNYYTLVTGGAGAYTMNVPDDYPYPKNIELAINLPPTWDIKSEEEKDYWPIRWLKTLARLPINHRTYLGAGHTIPTGEPLEGTNFSGIVLVGAQSSTEVDEEGNSKPMIIRLPSGKIVEFLYIVPIYAEEMDFKLEHNADELFDKFIENDIPYPPVVDIERKNTCEGYELSESPHLLDNIAWAFNDRVYDSLMSFWQDVKEYNNYINNDLEDIAPFATIFKTKKVKVMYEAYIKDEKTLWEYEKLIDPNIFENHPNTQGLYHAEIIAECEAYDSAFGALELLQWIHNSLSNKELGDHIFFEGFDIEGYEEDGTLVIYLHLGS